MFTCKYTLNMMVKS